jgi:hypothetical protein
MKVSATREHLLEALQSVIGVRLMSRGIQSG